MAAAELSTAEDGSLSGVSVLSVWMTTGLARSESLTGAEGPADTRILDFGNPIPSDTPWVTTGLDRAESLTGAEGPATTELLGPDHLIRW